MLNYANLRATKRLLAANLANLRANRRLLARGPFRKYDSVSGKVFVTSPVKYVEPCEPGYVCRNPNDVTIRRRAVEYIPPGWSLASWSSRPKSSR